MSELADRVRALEKEIIEQAKRNAIKIPVLDEKGVAVEEFLPAVYGMYGLRMSGGYRATKYKEITVQQAFDELQKALNVKLAFEEVKDKSAIVVYDT